MRSFNGIYWEASVPDPIVIRPWFVEWEYVTVLWREQHHVRCVRFVIQPYVDPIDGSRRFALCIANGFEEEPFTDSTYLHRDNARTRLENEVDKLVQNPREM